MEELLFRGHPEVVDADLSAEPGRRESPYSRSPSRLAGGGKWIRTLGPSRLILGEEKGRRSIRVVAKDAVPFHGGTSGSNPSCSAGESASAGTETPPCFCLCHGEDPATKSATPQIPGRKNVM